MKRCFDYTKLYNNIISLKSDEIIYLLGLMWADGSLNTKYTFGIGLVEKDMSELVSIFRKTGFPKPHLLSREKRGWQDCLYYSINSIKICNKLRKYRFDIKSVTSPDGLLKMLQHNKRHLFFRGYFDGDGHIRKDGTQVQMTSTYKQDWTFLIKLCKFLKIRHCIYRNRYKNNKGKINSRSVFYICGLKQVDIFMKFIYKGYSNNKLGLTRKFLAWENSEQFYKEKYIGTFKRQCPICSRTIFYHDKHGFNRSNNRNSKCKKCMFIKSCES